MASRPRDPAGDGTRTDVIPASGAAPLHGAMVRGPEGVAFPPELRLGRGPVRIGSGPGNAIVVRDRSVSRAHAELVATPAGVTVTDLGSTNGTFFFGQRVQTITLGLGTRFQVGTVTLALEHDTEALLSELAYDGDAYRGILGRSPRMRKMFAILARLEGTLATVLVEGESGAGKEGAALAIHQGSQVASGPFVTVNCGAIPPELVASELFGHKRGAFTGAVEARKGVFEQADGGTLFLDEIGELPLSIQPALLRAIELGEIRRVGSEESHKVTVRVVAATHRDLESDVAAGRFRQDLFYRLAVVRLQVPPLRERPEDIELLANHFARSLGVELPRQVVTALEARAWPGNARELRNAVQAYAAVGELPPPPATAGPSHPAEGSIDPTQPYAEQKDAVVDEFTRRYLKALLRYTNGNQAAAARIAKLDRTYLGRLLAKYGLAVRRFE